MKRKHSIYFLTLLFCTAAYSQTGISGPTCVNAGSSQTYTITGSWTVSTHMSWSVTGGTISGASSGTPLPQIHVTWNNPFSGGTVSVHTTSPTGSANLNVSASPCLVGEPADKKSRDLYLHK